MSIESTAIVHIFEDQKSYADHELTVSCWCNPTMGVNSVLTHHAERFAGPAGLTSEFRIPLEPYASNPPPVSIWPRLKTGRCHLFHNWSAWSETMESNATNNSSLDKWYQYRLCYRCKRIKRIWI